MLIPELVLDLGGEQGGSEIWGNGSWFGDPWPTMRPGPRGSETLGHPGSAGSHRRAENGSRGPTG